MPGKTCFISAFMYIGPGNSTCFQCQIKLLIQHQQCYGSRNNTGQASCFPAPVRKPYKNILQDTRNSMHLPRYKKLTSSEMPRYLANTAWCGKGSRAHLPVPEQQTEHLKHGATFLHESNEGTKHQYLLSGYLCFLTPRNFASESPPVFKTVPLLIATPGRLHSQLLAPVICCLFCSGLGEPLHLKFPCGSCTLPACQTRHINRILKSIHPT